MLVPLEEFVPYDRSVRWTLHDAYYAASGEDAWSSGDIPFFATSNLGIARQHAELVVGVVAELVRTGKLSARGKVHILEVGSGNGAFAANFFRALATECGDAGKALLKRVRYVLSEYSTKAVCEAIASDALRSHVAAGRVIPAIFDMRAPEGLTDLDGKPLDLPIAAVIANYVACVCRLKVVKKEEGRYTEQYVRVEADAPEGTEVHDGTGAELLARMLESPTQAGLMEKQSATFEWRPIDLEKLYADPIHARILERALAPHAAAAITYPHGFIEVLRAVKPRLVPGGLVLVNDYGSASTESLLSLAHRVPQHYGNAVNHGVDFPLFDAAGPELGYSSVRTHDPLRSVHTVALRNAKTVTKAFRETFERTHVARSDGEDLLVYSSAAKRHANEGEHLAAARLYDRCLRIDPESLDYLSRAVGACIDADQNERALELIERGRALDTKHKHDFDFQLGRVLYRRRKLNEALEAYARSLAHDPHPQTYVNMGAVHEEMGEPTKALVSYQIALAQNPEHEDARRRFDALSPKARPRR